MYSIFAIIMWTLTIKAHLIVNFALCPSWKSCVVALAGYSQVAVFGAMYWEHLQRFHF